MAAKVERRLAGILAADVVGYSRLMEADEAGTYGRLQDVRRELIEPLLREHGGRFVDLKGDGAIVEFRSVTGAVAAAGAIQRALAEREADLPEDRRIRYRIGINLGDVIVDGATVQGDGINLAARIECLCEPGGVWLTRSVYDQVKGKLDLAFAPAGTHRVKNISAPVETWRVVLEGAAPVRRPKPAHRPAAVAAAALLAAALGAAMWWLWPAGPAGGRPSIAVLPFDDLGGDPAAARLAGGITEDIITDLARFRDVDVIARNSTETYRGRAVDARAVGRDLAVRYVLEGSVQRDGGRVRVTAQLIDAGNGSHLWSERWDRPVGDLFLIQSELSENVTNRIAGFGAIDRARRTEARRKPPGDLDAYETYLLGTDALQHVTPEAAAEGRRLLESAVAQDPTLARAWTALTWANLQSAGWGEDRSRRLDAALEAARRAVELDPADAYAQAALGDALGHQGLFPQAEAAFDRALELNPGSADILTFYSGWAMSFGHAEAGARAADQARRLNPGYPPWAALGYFAYAYFNVGRYQDTADVLARPPPASRSSGDLVLEAGSLAMLGRTGDAKLVVARALAKEPGLSIEAVASDPGYSEPERQRLIETMRKAGFPACAAPEARRILDRPVRLPECARSQ